MKKYLLLLLLFSLALCGGQPLHSWVFTHSEEGKIPDNGTGAPKLPFSRTKLCTPMAGLNCPDGGYTFVEFPRKKLDCKELTFDVVFRLDTPLDKKRRVLFSYEHTAWRQAYFILQFNDKNQLEARICQRKNEQVLKEFTLAGAVADLAPGTWHDARVALSSGGEGSLWLDGALIDKRKNALSISDLDYTTKQYYPLLTFGTDPANPQQKTAFLRGSIASVKMWNTIEPPKLLEETAGENQQKERENSSILVTLDGNAPEWTCPFNVLDSEGAAAGSTVTADAKFVRCAGCASAALDGDALVVSFKCPIPEGVDPGIKPEGTVWSGDAVEFFFRPDKTQPLYYHYGAGINGKLYTAKMLAPRSLDSAFKSATTVSIENTPTEWRAVFRIPIAEIGLNTTPGSAHACNFTRSGPAAGGLQTWGPLATDFHQPDSFPAMIVGSRKSYFEQRLKESLDTLKTLPPNAPELHQKAQQEMQKLAETIASNGEEVAWYSRINVAFGNLSHLYTSIVLEGRPCVLWEPEDPYGNSLGISMLSKPVEKISITMPRNSEARRGLVFSNMTDKPFLGQIKCFEKWPLQSAGKTFNHEPWNDFLNGIRFAEGLPIMDSAKNIFFDPLAPLPMNTVIRAAPNGTIPLWMTVSSKGLDAGVYTGKLVVKGDYPGFGVQVVDLEVTVTNLNPDDYPCTNMNFTYLLCRSVRPEHVRFLADRGLNTIFAPLLGTYPEMKEDGSIGESDFSQLDKNLAICFANGFDQKSCSLIFYLAMERKWAMSHKGKIRFPYGTPQFEKAFKLYLQALASHLESTFGLRQEQLILYPCDEPGGDWDDPKSTMNIAWNAGNWIREALPNAHRFIDPHPFGNKRKKLTTETMDKIFGLFDIVMLHRPANTLPDVIEAAKKHNCTIWTYGILEKLVHPSVYRRFFWQNLRDGLGSTAAFWHVDSHAGGDGFDSFDCSGYDAKNRTDYGTLYADVNYGTLLSGRRFDAWSDGFTDYRIAQLCLKAIKGRPDQAELSAQLHTLFDSTAQGSIVDMENARAKLLQSYAKFTHCNTKYGRTAMDTMNTTQPDIQISSLKTETSTLDYAKIAGGQKTFVLLPGLYTKSLMPLAPAVAMQYKRFLGAYTIYMFDRISEPPEHYTVQEMAADTIRAMDALGIRDAYMMGVSAGGMVAQAIAAERPDLVKRVVIGSSTPAMTEHARGILNGWSALAKAGKADELGRSFAEMIYTDAFFARHKDAIMASLAGTTEAELKRFAIFADGLCSFDMTPNLRSITCPVLAIGAAQDRIFPPKQAMDIARLTNGSVFIFENYGHAVYDEAADYLDKVWNFFEEK